MNCSLEYILKYHSSLEIVLKYSKQTRQWREAQVQQITVSVTKQTDKK